MCGEGVLSFSQACPLVASRLCGIPNNTLPSLPSFSLQTPYHDALVGAWFELVSSDYNGSSYVSSDQQVGEVEARKTAM